MKWNDLRSVLAPVDLSDPDDAGIRMALEACPRPEAVHVIHVLPPVEISPMLPDPAVKVSEVRGDLRAWLTDRALPAGLRTHVAVSARPEQAIAELAAALRVDLVILPSHGRRGLQRLLLGSVAEQVVRLAPCPVLVLRSADA
jgi:nucleotide-binding universal stress UspA family protein